jgi:hypothetical protein
VNETGQDQFYDLKHPTIANEKSALTWVKERSIKTFVDYLDCSESTARQPSDMPFDAVLKLIDKSAAELFRVILRKNYNWFGILSNDAHVEDVIEIGIRGIKDGKKELFIFSYLEEKWFEELGQVVGLLEIT